MSLEKKLRAILKEERYNQREFAESIDTPLRSVQNYLSGKQEPTAGVLMKIVNHPNYKKYALWLMTGEVAPDNGQVCPSFSILEQCDLVESESQKRA